MNQNGSITLFQYWNRLRDGRSAPKRSEVEPADIKSLLADTFILEKDTRGEAVFRLAGTRLCASYGRELKGFSFPSLWRQKDQRLVHKLIRGVFDQKSVVLITYEGLSQNGRSNRFELLALPLDGGIENPRCLGVISAVEKALLAGGRPDHRRFDPRDPHHRSGQGSDVPEKPPGDRRSLACALRFWSAGNLFSAWPGPPHPPSRGVRRRARRIAPNLKA